MFLTSIILKEWQRNIKEYILNNDYFKNILSYYGNSKKIFYKAIYGKHIKFGKGVTFRKGFSLVIEDGANVEIGNNCWIGSNTIILKEVTIGENTIIAAGEIIRKNIDDNNIYLNNKSEKINYIIK